MLRDTIKKDGTHEVAHQPYTPQRHLPFFKKSPSNLPEKLCNPVGYINTYIAFFFEVPAKLSTFLRGIFETKSYS